MGGNMKQRHLSILLSFGVSAFTLITLLIFQNFSGINLPNENENDIAFTSQQTLEPLATQSSDLSKKEDLQSAPAPENSLSTAESDSSQQRELASLPEPSPSKTPHPTPFPKNP